MRITSKVHKQNTGIKSINIKFNYISSLRDSDLADVSKLVLSEVEVVLNVIPAVHISSLTSFNFSQSFLCQSWR